MPDELARITRVPLFESHAPMELMRAAYVTHRFAPHAHEEVAIGVEGGAVRTRVGTRTIVVPGGGWVIAFNPGEVHTGEPVDAAGYRYRMFYIGESLFRFAAGWEPLAVSSSMPASTPIFTNAAIYDPALSARLLHAHALLETGADRLLAQSVFVDAIGDLGRRHGSADCRHPLDQPHTDVVRTVRAYLEDEHARVATLAELSTLTGLSPFHVSHVFRAAMGMPPYAFLALARVRRAQALIRSGHPLSVVTHATGFADQSHFTRQFKRVVGVPPGQYARDVARPTVAFPTAARPRTHLPPLSPPRHDSPHTDARLSLALRRAAVRHYTG